jgi:hypothetical protein
MLKKMKQVFILTVFVFTTIHSFALNDKVRLGIVASPGITWARPMGKDLLKGNPHFGVDFGLTAEYWFAKNYGFVSGIMGGYEGINVRGRDYFENTTLGIKYQDVNERYIFNYLAIPVQFKLKTNQIKDGKFNIWGQVGFNINVIVSARATFSNPVPTYDPFSTTPFIAIEKENIMKKANDVSLSIPGFRSGFVDVRLVAGGGFEYAFDDKTSLVVGLVYQNGFINSVIDKDAKKEAILMRNMGLRVGVLF